MKRLVRGLTLIELMIVVAVISILAALAIPNILRCRMAANEATTLGTLKTIATQQAIFKYRKEVDQNGDGTGEYGLIGELSGELALRPFTSCAVTPPYLSAQMLTGGNVGSGAAQKSGFFYMIFLSNATPGSPNAAGNDYDLGGNTQTGGPAADPAAMPFQQSYFAVYAWPVEVWRSGGRAIFINETGETYWTKMDVVSYDGVVAHPAANAAYRANAPLFRSRISEGATRGHDRNQWHPTGG